jgi:3-dehydroquinate synthase
MFMGYLERSCHRRVCHLLENLGFQLWNDMLTERADNGRLELLEGLREFREHLGGQLHVTMLRDIGESFEVTEMDDVVIATAIEALAAHSALPAGSANAARPAVQ